MSLWCKLSGHDFRVISRKLLNENTYRTTINRSDYCRRCGADRK